MWLQHAVLFPSQDPEPERKQTLLEQLGGDVVCTVSIVVSVLTPKGEGYTMIMKEERSLLGAVVVGVMRHHVRKMCVLCP